MSSASPFERLSPPGETVTFRFEGREIRAAAGESLAAALLAADAGPLRLTPATGAPRGPWCMMGACYDCLVEVDGASVQACMTPVRAGLTVRRLQRVPGSGDG